jgi:hypothetical protein
MATKHTSTCISKAADDEPIFALRAQDMSAPILVEFWVKMNPQLPEQKKQDALQVVHEMREWQRNNPKRVKKAD